LIASPNAAEPMRLCPFGMKDCTTCSQDDKLCTFFASLCNI